MMQLDELCCSEKINDFYSHSHFNSSSCFFNRPKSNDDEDFYFTDIEEDEDEAISMDASTTTPPLPPTLSHSDMARPPHEDPEYQKKYVGSIRQELLSGAQFNVKSSNHMMGSNTVIHNYAWSQTSSVSSLHFDYIASIGKI